MAMISENYISFENCVVNQIIFHVIFKKQHVRLRAQEEWRITLEKTAYIRHNSSDCIRSDLCTLDVITCDILLAFVPILS